MNNYNSIEDFIHQNGRYPNTDEVKLLYSSLWNKYLSNTNEAEKQIALSNSTLNSQSETIKKIQPSLEKFKNSIKSKENIISVQLYERWGMYKIGVIVNCSKKELYKIRKYIPNFYEGWEVALFPASLIERISFLVKSKLYKKNA